MTNEILYVGIFKLPDRNAAAIRVRGIADALNAAGYSVTLIGDDYVKPAEGERKVSPFQCVVKVGKRAADYFLTASSYLDKIDSIDRRIAAIICYPGSAALVWHLMRYCRKHAVPLIIDSTEWYDPGHTLGGRFGFFALDSEFRMRWLHMRACNIICISSFLSQYYYDKGCNVLRIPPLVGMKEDRYGSDLAAPSLQSSDHLSLTYAGFPGRKELFSELIAGVEASRKHGINVSLRLVGITECELMAIVKKNGDRAPNCDGITCHGRLPREEALQIIIASDFTVLLRPWERFANAGFPSKFVESLSLGVPVMANATSDIAEYLRDGCEGYLLSEPTASALESAIVRASRLTVEQKKQMRIQAHLRAHECFGYQNYSGVLAEFLSSAQQCD